MSRDVVNRTVDFKEKIKFKQYVCQGEQNEINSDESALFNFKILEANKDVNRISYSRKILDSYDGPLKIVVGCDFSAVPASDTLLQIYAGRGRRDTVDRN